MMRSRILVAIGLLLIFAGAAFGLRSISYERVVSESYTYVEMVPVQKDLYVNTTEVLHHFYVNTTIPEKGVYYQDFYIAEPGWVEIKLKTARNVDLVVAGRRVNWTALHLGNTTQISLDKPGVKRVMIVSNDQYVSGYFDGEFWVKRKVRLTTTSTIEYTPVVRTGIRNVKRFGIEFYGDWEDAALVLALIIVGVTVISGSMVATDRRWSRYY
jgi:hypothetical protein